MPCKTAVLVAASTVTWRPAAAPGTGSRGAATLTDTWDMCTAMQAMRATADLNPVPAALLGLCLLALAVAPDAAVLGLLCSPAGLLFGEASELPASDTI